MSRIYHSIDVAVPVATAYHRWTRFEEFPRFMEGVDRVVRLADGTLDWTATIGGQTRRWQARVVEQVPNQRIAWVSTGGAPNDGVVTFQPLSPDRTRIDLAMDIEPDGAMENLGDALGVVDARIRGDLERFRDIVERRGSAAGAWRGELPDAHTDRVGADEPAHRDPVGTGLGFAEGQADPSLTRRERGTR
jgi:uncharacterized membrane protein